MVEAEFFLELLMRLFTDPPRLDRGGEHFGLDRGGEHFERGVGRQVRHAVFLLSGRSALADKPDLVTRHALHAVALHPVLMTIRKADAAGRKEVGQRTLGTSSPTDFSPLLVSRHRLCAHRRLVGNVVLSALAGFGDREDQLNIGRVDGLASRKPDGPQ